MRARFHLAAGAAADRPDARWQGVRKRVKTGRREEAEVEEWSGQTGVTGLSDGGGRTKNGKKEKETLECVGSRAAGGVRD